MADIANNGFVWHFFHVGPGDDFDIAGTGHENIADGGCLLHGHNAVAFHGCLQSTDRIDLGDINGGPHTSKSLSAALTHIAVTDNNCVFSGNHHIGCPLYTVNERFTAAVQIVKF